MKLSDRLADTEKVFNKGTSLELAPQHCTFRAVKLSFHSVTANINPLMTVL